MENKNNDTHTTKIRKLKKVTKTARFYKRMRDRKADIIQMSTDGVRLTVIAAQVGVDVAYLRTFLRGLSLLHPDQLSTSTSAGVREHVSFVYANRHAGSITRLQGLLVQAFGIGKSRAYDVIDGLRSIDTALEADLRRTRKNRRAAGCVTSLTEVPRPDGAVA